MNYTKRFLLYGLMILFASMSLAACQATTPASLNPAQTPGISLSITSNICPSLTVTTSDQITLTNQDQQIHLIRIKSLEGNILFDFSDLQPGDTASFNITQAGNYVYVCSSDQKSTGTITVVP